MPWIFSRLVHFFLRTWVPGPLAHPSWDVAARAQGQLSPSAAVGGPVLADDEQRHPDSTLTAV